jgi:hypothetical protein
MKVVGTYLSNIILKSAWKVEQNVGHIVADIPPARIQKDLS